MSPARVALLALAIALVAFGIGRALGPAPPVAPPDAPGVSGVTPELLGPGADQTVLVRLAAPTRLSWGGSELTWLAEPGVRRVPRPAARGAPLRWSAGGASGMLAPSEGSLLDLGLGALRVAGEPGEGADRGALARTWTDLRGWLRPLASGGAPAPPRAELLARWEDWATWRAWRDREQAMSVPGEWDPGLRSREAPSLEAAAEVRLRPEGGDAPGSREENWSLVTPTAKASPFDATQDAATTLAGSWAAPAGAGALGVALQYRRIPWGTRVVVEAGPVEAPRRVLTFWRLAEESLTGVPGRWQVAWLPRDLAPRPGEGVRLRLEAWPGQTLSAARLQRLYVLAAE